MDFDLVKVDLALDKKKIIFNLFYGIALCLVGVLMIITIPDKMARLEQNHPAAVMYFGRFLLYVMAVLLVCGGAKKIFDNYQRLYKKDST